MRRETSIARHVSRYIRFGQKAPRYSFVGKERYLWIANFTRYIHVGLLISTLPASVPERETIELFREMSRNDSFFLPFTVIIINLSSHSALIYNEIFVSLLKFTFEQSSQQRGELLRIFA